MAAMGARSVRNAVLVALVGLSLASCGATTTAISKRNLDVQTKMTESIFLDPVPADQRTVFVQVRNTSDKPDFDIEPAVRASIESRGFRVVDDPTEAHYLLQANVLQAGRSTDEAADNIFAGGFGSTVLGGAAGAGAGRVLSENPSVIIGGALAGAAIAAVADAFVQDVTYSIISDVQVSERAGQGVVVTESAHQDLSQGTSGNRVLSSTETSDWKRYRTRVMSKADKVNLEFEEAAPDLVAGLTRSIAGIF
jgi:Enterobacterial TraT complement resistance protein